MSEPISAHVSVPVSMSVSACVSDAGTRDRNNVKRINKQTDTAKEPEPPRTAAAVARSKGHIHSTDVLSLLVLFCLVLLKNLPATLLFCEGSPQLV